MPAAIEEFRCQDPAAAAGALSGRDRPLVLRGLCADWPLVQLARGSDTDFARGLAQHDNGTPVDVLLMAPEEDGVIGYNAAFDGFNYRHFRVSVTEALQRLAACSRMDRPQGLALQSAPIASCLPGLLDTHAMPLLDADIRPRLWIGNRVTTPVHFDEYHNIAVVACGRRRFTLFPPEQVGNLYIGPLDFAPTGAAIGLARLDRPDDPRFPRLREALAHAQAAELHPGDALYLPPLWWHHVASLDPLNALMNYWWTATTPGAQPSSTGCGALMHALLALRGLPPAQRAAWRVLMEHYVFGEHDPAAHLPERWRGPQGAPTPEQARALREKILRSL